MNKETDTEQLIIDAERAIFEWLRNRPVIINGLNFNNTTIKNDISGNLLWQPVNISEWIESKSYQTNKNDKLVWLAGMNKIITDDLSLSASAVYKTVGKDLDKEISKWPNLSSSSLPKHFSTILQAVLQWWVPPIFLVSKPANDSYLSVHHSCFKALLQKPVQITQTTAELPIKLKSISNTLIKVFTNDRGLSHIVLQFGNPKPDDEVLVRIHSQCITGDILNSLRCDCGLQLSNALQQLQNTKSGYLLYMREEGRAIGIDNKIHAYHIQDSKNLNTYDANNYLGFGWDNRDFSEASQILTQLDVKKIKLLTNNPFKVTALNNAGFQVRRQTLSPKLDKIAKSYKQVKSKQGSHLL